jgi:signal transduction histidine kinase
MRLAPQSLFGRLLASVLAVVGITLTVIVVLILQDRRELALRVGGAYVTSQRIADITHTVSRLEGPAREAELERLREQPVVVGQVEPRVIRRRLEAANLADRFASQLHRQLGDGYRVTIRPAQPGDGDVIRIVTAGPRLSPDLRVLALPPSGAVQVHEATGPHVKGRQVMGETYIVGGTAGGEPMAGAVASGKPSPPHFDFLPPPPPGSGPITTIMTAGPGRPPMVGLFDVNVVLPDGDNVVFRTSPPLMQPPLPIRIFLELGILTVALGLALYMTTRSITRPLSDLAQAADAVGRSVRHPKLAEKGAREIRDATRAFNAMQDRLLRYLDSRTRVLAAMSHDLRTPLTRLRLRVESINDPALRDRFGVDLDEMEGLVRGALSLFKGLNDEETAEAVDIDALLAAVQAGFAELGAKVSIQGRALEPLPAKPLALKRCLTNLLENAVKFGTQAILTVDDGQALVIRVQDDGPGIPEDALEQVFEPFFRLESSRNRDTGGTGLGLTIARDIAQAHGGTLVLHNLPERGLEAVLTLPRHQHRK